MEGGRWPLGSRAGSGDTEMSLHLCFQGWFPKQLPSCLFPGRCSLPGIFTDGPTERTGVVLGQAWIWGLTSCGTRGRSLNRSEPQLPHLKVDLEHSKARGEVKMRR